MRKHFFFIPGKITFFFLVFCFFQVINFYSYGQIKRRPIPVDTSKMQPHPVPFDNQKMQPHPIPVDTTVIITQPHLFPYTIKLNQADLAAYNETTDAWAQSMDIFDKHQLKFTYTLFNKIFTKPGRIRGDIDGVPFTAPSPNSNVIGVIEPNQNFTGEFFTNTLPAGNYLGHLYYITQGMRLNQHTFQPEPFDSVAASVEFTYNVNVTIEDSDIDGIDDRVEDTLLKRFRPYFKFSLQGEENLPKSALNPGFIDKYRPTDVFWYIQRSELLTPGQDEKNNDPAIPNSQLQQSPSNILFDATNVTKTKSLTNYSVNPLQNVPGINEDNPGRHGAEWAEVMVKKNIGLYGHVVPILLMAGDDGVLNYDRHHVLSGSDAGALYYKIEYWQFFGFNECYCGDPKEHEGDWETVQLLYNPRTNVIEAVFYYEHGTKEIRYNMRKTIRTVPINNDDFPENITEFEAENFDTYQAGEDTWSVDILDKAVRFFADPETGEYTHPVVYIENGSHEPWPVPQYRYPGVPNHDGDDHDHTFLANTPPNLGEIEHPLTEAPGSDEILQFNGNWGTKNGGARGPSGHLEWSWPASSSVRWVLTGLSD